MIAFGNPQTKTDIEGCGTPSAASGSKQIPVG
jgi:hypothetical protein